MAERFRMSRSARTVIAGRTGLLSWPVIILTILLAASLSFVRASGGGQLDQDSIKTGTLSVESLVVGTPGAGGFATLGTDPGNQVALDLFNVGNSRRIQVGVFRKGTPTLVLGGRPETRMNLSLSDSGEPAFWLSTPRKDLVGLDAFDGLGPRLSFKGAPDIQMSITGSTGPGGSSAILAFTKGTTALLMDIGVSRKLANVGLLDTDSRPRTTMGMTPRSQPMFLLYDRGRNPVVEMTLDADGKPRIRSTDPATRASRTLK